MRRSVYAAIACVLLTAGGVAAADPAEMPTRPFLIGPQLGAQFHDDTNAVIGVGARFGVYMFTPAIRLDIVPNFNYYFVDNAHVIELSGDVAVAFGLHNDIAEPYALAGLGIFIEGFNDDVCRGVGGCDSITRLGFDIGGGVKFLPVGKVQPFVQLRFTIGDIDPYNLMGGVLFLIQ
jgi:hypothetical protein